MPLESNYLVVFDNERFKNGILYFENVFELLPVYIRAYISLFSQLCEANRYFVCASIIGCKGVTSFPSRLSLTRPIIDRNIIICPPTVFLSDSGDEDKNMKMFELNFALALGIRTPDIIDPLIKDVYPND